jgi:hypothetical protein
MTSASGTQRRSSGPPGAGLAFDLSVRIRLPRRPTLRMLKDPSGATAVGTRWHEAVRIAPGCWLRIDHRETLRPPNRGPGGALLPWLPAVIARPLRRHVAERLDDIRAYVESGA